MRRRSDAKKLRQEADAIVVKSHGEAEGFACVLQRRKRKPGACDRTRGE